jgi:3-hydroxy-5-phosphonooxypentane-2,4-dione thiolase
LTKEDLIMDWGMKSRLSRLIQADGRCCFLPIDHGYFQEPTRKLEKPGQTIKPLIKYADGLFVTRGVLRACVDPTQSPPVILRVSGGTSIIGKDLACEAVTASIVSEKTNADQAEELFLTEKNKS